MAARQCTVAGDAVDEQKRSTPSEDGCAPTLRPAEATLRSHTDQRRSEAIAAGKPEVLTPHATLS